MSRAAMVAADKPAASRGRPRLTLGHAQGVAAARGGVCISKEYRGAQTKLAWRCGEGHEWSALLSNIKNMGSWCPRCAVRGRPRLTLKEAQEAARARGGECMSAEAACEGSTSSLHWRCGEGHEWVATLASVRALGTWCPHCRASKAERVCRDLLTRALGPPSLERRPRFTRTPDSPVGLELDVYYPQHGFAVEVQGEQHRSRVPMFQPTEESYESQMARDARKRELCEENWVVLLELWPEDDIRAKLQEFLEDLAIPFDEAALKV